MRAWIQRISSHRHPPIRPDVDHDIAGPASSVDVLEKRAKEGIPVAHGLDRLTLVDWQIE